METKGSQIKGDHSMDMKTDAKQPLGSRPGSAQLDMGVTVPVSNSNGRREHETMPAMPTLGMGNKM